MLVYLNILVFILSCFRFCDLLNGNSVPFFLFYAANRWLAVFLDCMTIVVTGATGFLIVFTLSSDNSSEAGLALSFAIQVRINITFIAMNLDIIFFYSNKTIKGKILLFQVLSIVNVKHHF